MSAPLSTRAWVSTAFIVHVGSSIWRGIRIDFEDDRINTRALEGGEDCVD